MSFKGVKDCSIRGWLGRAKLAPHTQRESRCQREEVCRARPRTSRGAVVREAPGAPGARLRRLDPGPEVRFVHRASSRRSRARATARDSRVLHRSRSRSCALARVACATAAWKRIAAHSRKRRADAPHPLVLRTSQGHDEEEEHLRGVRYDRIGDQPCECTSPSSEKSPVLIY